MEALLDRWRALGVWPRRLVIGACVVLAAFTVLPQRGDHRHGRALVPHGSVATVITVEPGAASALRAGDRIDVVDTGDESSGTGRVLASDVRVLSVESERSFGARASHITVATDRVTALLLAVTQGRRTLAVIALPP